MPQTIEINTMADLQPAIDRLTTNPADQFTLNVSSELRVSIIVKGKSWDGFVDVRVARYVTELQKTHDRLVRECSLESSGDKLLVKVKIKDGSTELETSVVDFLGRLTANMTNTQQFVIALSMIGCLFAGWSLTKILEHIRQTQREKLDHEATVGTQRDLTETLRFALQKIDPQKAPRALVGTMTEEDTIKLPGESEAISRNDARARFPRRARVVPIDAKIDDNYHVTSIALEQPVKLQLTRGEFSFRASLSPVLADADKDQFVQNVKASLEGGAAVRMSLLVDAKIGPSAVAEATVVGIGHTPRPEAEDIADLID